MNPEVENLLDHPSTSLSESARRDSEVIDLTVGVPCTSVFDGEFAGRLSALLRGLSESSGVHAYAQSAGNAEARYAVAHWHAKRHGHAADAESEVLVTNGASEGIALTILCTTRVGGTVIVGDPSYSLYSSVAIALGRRVARVPFRVGSAGAYCPRRLSQELARARGNAVLVLNSPANPCGTVVSAPEIEELVKLCSANDAYLLHDEVLDETATRGTHVSATVFGAPHVVSVNSISKKLGLPGWRFGWLIGHQRIVTGARRCHSYMCLASATLPQQLAASVLRWPGVAARVDAWHARLRKLRARYTRELRLIDGIVFSPREMDAGCFLYPNVEGFARRLGAPKAASPGEFASRLLLRECSVAVVPGSAFGLRSAGHIRVSAVRSPSLVMRALDRIQTALA